MCFINSPIALNSKHSLNPDVSEFQLREKKVFVVINSFLFFFFRFRSIKNYSCGLQSNAYYIYFYLTYWTPVEGEWFDTLSCLMNTYWECPVGVPNLWISGCLWAIDKFYGCSGKWHQRAWVNLLVGGSIAASDDFGAPHTCSTLTLLFMSSVNYSWFRCFACRSN